MQRLATFAILFLALPLLQACATGAAAAGVESCLVSPNRWSPGYREKERCRPYQRLQGSHCPHRRVEAGPMASAVCVLGG